NVNPDGSFVLENVAPGVRYRIRMPNIPSGGYLLNGALGKTNALNEPVVFEDGVTLQLQIGFAPGRVEAIVLDRDLPQSGLMTVLVPNDRGRLDLYRT